MSSRDVNGQPGWTKGSVTIDYLLVLLHTKPSFVWFMQAQVETPCLCVPDGALSLARNIPPHQKQSNTFTPLRLRFAQQKSLPKSAALPLVGHARRCRVNSHSEVAPCSCTRSRLCRRSKYRPPLGSVRAEGATHICSLSTSQPNLPSDQLSSTVIVTSIGISPRVLVPSAAGATAREQHWLMQWPLEGLLGFSPGRGSACDSSLPHFHRFYANVVDLLLGTRSTSWGAVCASEAWRRSHLTDRALASG